MKTYCFFIGLFLTVLFSLPVNSQIRVEGEQEVIRKMNNGELKMIQRSDRKLSRADKYASQIRNYDRAIESLQNSKGRIRTGKINRLERKINELMTMALPYYKAGYKLRYKAFENYIKANGRGDEGEMILKAQDRFRQGSKLYRKSDNVSSEKRQSEMIALGNQKKLEALNIQLSIAKPLGIPVAQETNQAAPQVVAEVPALAVPVVQPVDSVVNIPEVKPEESMVVVKEPQVVVMQPVAEVVAPVAEPVSSPAKAAKLTGDVFLTVQLMASKTPVPREQLRQKYSGKEEIMEMRAADWYRYVVGKFSSVDEAKSFMAESNLQGIVTAYKNGERISVQEALSLIQSKP
jgi:hypothetical protein